jgi:aryl-alcohol dehydrogenase-like predicted oxidoreductase
MITDQNDGHVGKVSVPDRLGFGCGALSTLGSPSASRHLLEGVFDLGIRHFDTAPVYGRGYSERLLGEFLHDKRERVSVATKFGLVSAYAPPLPLGLAMRLGAAKRWLAGTRSPRREDSGPPTPGAAESRPVRHIERATVQAAFDASRRSLNTDYLDLYLLHENLPSALKPQALDLLLDLKASGRVRKLGLAANGSRYLPLSEDDVAQWDVLQYEYGPAWPAHAGLPAQFPTKVHIFHSCLRGVTGGSVGADGPGRTLAQCLSHNIGGRILFSSTKLRHVRENLRALGSHVATDADH